MLFNTLLVVLPIAAQKVVLTNNNGWAVAMIRAQYEALKGAGYEVILSAPAENQSGTGSSSKTPTALKEPCQFDSCPTGLPAEGANASDSFLNYVNTYPVDAVLYGIQTLSPQLFDSVPDLVVSGPNNNLGLSVLFSGTIFWDSISYTTLTSDPNSDNTRTSRIISSLAVTFRKVLSFLPSPNISINVNFPSTQNCAESNYKWNPFATDVTTCGSSSLPTESNVVDAGCFASVSITLKTDADEDGFALGTRFLHCKL
ncbi:survival protein sure-like phosphatase/nucleotidase [Mucidula mucida]|nr:survival protein sure-like phosphatase/nucleotidase [Mucidula mucida]